MLLNLQFLSKSSLPPVACRLDCDLLSSLLLLVSKDDVEVCPCLWLAASDAPDADAAAVCSM